MEMGEIRVTFEHSKTYMQTFSWQLGQKSESLEIWSLGMKLCYMLTI